MKKISALLFIILGLPILAANFIISGGASLQRKVDISVDEVVLVTQENIDNSYDIGFEAFFPITEKFEWGTGIRFQPTFISNDLEDGFADVVPVYMILKMLFPMGDTALTLQADGGYNFPIEKSGFDATGFTDLQGGAYLGLGVGYEMGSVVIAGTYVISNLQVKAVNGTIDADIIATMLNVTVGYKYWKI